MTQSEDWRPLESYALAERYFLKVRDLPYNDALEVVRLNIDEIETEYVKFAWQVVECKLIARNRKNRQGATL